MEKRVLNERDKREIIEQAVGALRAIRDERDIPLNNHPDPGAFYDCVNMVFDALTIALKEVNRAAELEKRIKEGE